MTQEQKLKLIQLIRKEELPWNVHKFLTEECQLSWDGASQIRKKAEEYVHILQAKRTVV